MIIGFRQGIVKHQTPPFLAINTAGNVDLLANNNELTITVAHKNENYIHSETKTVNDAWTGPFDPNLQYWLYIFFDNITFSRSFHVTNLEPIVQSSHPSTGNPTIFDTILGSNSNGAFIIKGYFQLRQSKTIEIINSLNNNGIFTVVSSEYDGAVGTTTIYVEEQVNDDNTGILVLNFDTNNIPYDTHGRIWYNPLTFTHYINNSGYWNEIIGIGIAKLTNGNVFHGLTENNSFIGSQIGINGEFRAGRILFDTGNKSYIRDDGTFLTTETDFYAGSSKIDSIRLESNIVRAKTKDASLSKFNVVSWVDDGIITSANYNDIGSTIVGILTTDLSYNESGSVILQGTVTNPSWNWLQSPNPISVGSPLWVLNGILTPIDPHLNQPQDYPIGMVPIARVLSNDTIIFEQGLGGKGDKGDKGDDVNVPIATPSTPGIVTLLTDSSDANNAFVISDADPRLTDARVPLPHIHDATNISITPTCTITSNTLQDGLTELCESTVKKSGDIMSGFLTLASNPSIPLHAATKQYVDDKVSGLIWLQPVEKINLISDAETQPPSNPENGDAYIIPPYSIGDWSNIPVGNIVTWDGINNIWVDNGSIQDLHPDNIHPTRIGISFTSNTLAGGSFSGHDNEIAIFDQNSGTLISFEIPQDNNAVYVANVASQHAFDQYAFSNGQWNLFGTASAVTADQQTIVKTGNILSVKQFNDGGTVDATYWQGLVPSDLHSQTLSITPYTTSPNWGTLQDPSISQQLANNIQTAINEVVDKKAAKTPSYTCRDRFPNAITVKGMLAFSEFDGKFWYSNGTKWVPLLNVDDYVELSYDLQFFISDHLNPNLPADSILDSIIVNDDITIVGGIVGKAICNSPPSNQNYTFDIRTYDATTGNYSNIGDIAFYGGINEGSLTIFNDTIINAGQAIQIVNSTQIADPTLNYVTIMIPSTKLTQMKMYIPPCAT